MPWWAHALMGVAAVFTAGAALVGAAPVVAAEAAVETGAVVGGEIAAEAVAAGTAEAVTAGTTEAVTATTGEVIAETAPIAAETGTEVTAAEAVEVLGGGGEGGAEGGGATVEISGLPEGPGEFTPGLDSPGSEPGFYGKQASKILEGGEQFAKASEAAKGRPARHEQKQKIGVSGKRPGAGQPGRPGAKYSPPIKPEQPVDIAEAKRQQDLLRALLYGSSGRGRQFGRDVSGGRGRNVGRRLG